MAKLAQVTGSSCTVEALEHDGVFALGDPQACLDKVAHAMAPLRVAIKAMAADPMRALQDKTPGRGLDCQADP